MAEISRREKTKYKPTASVKECTKAQPVDKITVKNIAEGCGVTHQTFYRSFLDKYDLINWYFDKLAFQPSKQTGMRYTVRKNLIRKFELILNEKVSFIETFYSDGKNSLKEYDFGLILKLYADLLAREDSKVLDQELQLLLEMYCQGPVYVTVRWVLGSMKDSPRDVSGKLVRTMPPELAEVSGRLKPLQVIIDSENSQLAQRLREGGRQRCLSLSFLTPRCYNINEQSKPKRRSFSGRTR